MIRETHGQIVRLDLLCEKCKQPLSGGSRKYNYQTDGDSYWFWCADCDETVIRECQYPRFVIRCDDGETYALPMDRD